MKEGVTLFMYSHSSYSDVWDVFFQQAEKYLQNYKKVLFSDKVQEVPDSWELIQYKDSDSYSERMSSCLEKIETDLCFLHHEDMFLYDEPKYDILKEYENIVRNEDVDFVRLLRSTDAPFENYKDSETLYLVPSYSQYFFSVQPSICKTDSLLKIYKNTKIDHIHEFEPRVQVTCRNLDIKGLFHYDHENKRGMFHYDSNVYPYVATAIVKGKWNFSEYTYELKPLIEEKGIDINIRGVS